MEPTAVLDPKRVICSSISLRHLKLPQALDVIGQLGFTTIDLGALPGVCDHVPYELTSEATAEIAAVVRASGLAVRSVNCDVGDLNRPLDSAGQQARFDHARRLLELSRAIGSRALVLPNGALQHEPIVTLPEDLALVAQQLMAIAELCAASDTELWVEAPHFFRLCFDLPRAVELLKLLPAEIGVVCDVSHIVASGSTPRAFVAAAGERIRHVHLRDASPGYIHHSIGNGQVDFADAIAALTEAGYDGVYSLELETRDVTDGERPAAALRAGQYISSQFGSS